MENKLIVFLIISLFVISVISALFLRIHFLEMGNVKLTQKISLQNDSIEAWKQQAKIDEANLVTAEAQASLLMFKENSNIEKIDNENVPKDCLGSIRWASKKAAEITQ